MAAVNEKKDKDETTWQMELEAINVCTRQVAALNNDAQIRVLRYLADRFGIYWPRD